jgi:hypothetical protein
MIYFLVFFFQALRGKAKFHGGKISIELSASDIWSPKEPLSNINIMVTKAEFQVV